MSDGLTFGCFSKEMKSAETNYPTTDQELLEIDVGLMHLNTILE